ncbi:hypothetical protein [Effusibacillus lacus]|uniref:Uncharacterized protein n=1 Tax=Effusibacillus lacus TaxID=1348429 RepID=A0A292YKS7_9BACL|nr:hypothetical protein [Effusibacillus lacus]TCS75342.1 hypothetical protein EDD64_10894 [Effusibacillus lacus]GAX89776.1 hypothetical protein EFBL_1401 [Effusibacillus lacus]
MEMQTPLPLPPQQVKQLAHLKAKELGLDYLVRHDLANHHLQNSRKHTFIVTRKSHNYL